METSAKAIIIGASSGIGRELAMVLAQNGYEVGMVARRIDLLKTIQNEISTKTYIKQIDITKTEVAIKELKGLIAEMGEVNLIVIAAGIYFEDHDLIWEKEKTTIEVNVLGFAAMADVAFNYFSSNGYGHIVGISSVKAHRGGRKATAYNASKAFVSNYLEGLRKKAYWKSLDIQVTTIEPGFVDTPMYVGSKKRSILIATKEKAANQIFKVIFKKKDHAYITKRWSIVAWMYKRMPYFIYKRL
jgi:short-subunit dehydrogenase